MRTRLAAGSTITLLGLALGLVLGACGGEAEMAPPPPPPPPPGAPEQGAPPPGPIAAPPPPAAAAGQQPAGPPMAELQKKAIVGYTAAFNAHDGKKAAEAYSKDCFLASPGATGMIEQRGRDTVEKMHAGLFAAFPDLKVATARVFQKGNVAVEEWASNGTHKGDSETVKATNKATGFNAISILWFEADGSIKRDNTYFDVGTIEVQMGLQKGRARAVPKLAAGDGEWIVSKGTPDEDKLVESVRAYYATFEKHDEKSFLDMLTDDIVHSSMNEADDKTGKKTAKDDFGAFQKAFPDLRIVASSAWGFGNYVVAESTFTGTNKGPMGPIKATNKALTVHYVDVFQFKDGKISRSTSYASNIEMLGQLGLLTPPKAPDAKPAKPAEGKKEGAKPAEGKKEGQKPPATKPSEPGKSGGTPPAKPAETAKPAPPKPSAAPTAAPAAPPKK